MEISDIIRDGKLKTYQLNRSFLEVYWSHPSLEAHQYYLFMFTALKYDFVSVKAVAPKYLPVRHKPKIYVPAIERVMYGLLSKNS